MSHRIDRLRVMGLTSGRRGWRATRGSLDEAFARNRHEFYRLMWQDAARSVGADIEDLGDAFSVLRRGTAETLVWKDEVMLDHPPTTALAGDKELVVKLLRLQGIPVPDQRAFGRDEVERANEFLQSRPGPFVVKPANGTGGGAGVTCGVMNAEDLWRAWLGATTWDSRILVEPQVSGDEYRLLFLDGELLDVIRRTRPRVHGDGSSTVAELVDAENRRRIDSGGLDVGTPIRIDLDCELALRSEGFTPKSILPSGVALRVKTRSNEAGSAERFTVRGLAPQFVDEAARAAAAVKLRLAGVDAVISDPHASLAEAGGAILEVNSNPGLHHHYQVADAAAATPVAVPILELLLDEADLRRS
jgi:cyanophycin synthetase